MKNQIAIHADQPGPLISRHIYGHFAEHLGRCIYDGIWVGENSPVPAVRGIRTDVVAALREIGIPNLRWPGGCFADTYHWMDGIGPREQRPATINRHWGDVTETNHFGTHEFMDLCEQLGCEPYICGNVGSGSVQEMAQWLEYLTCAATSATTVLRRKNGMPAPWRVHFWGVGNENWACGGNMRPEFYADLFRQYAAYLPEFGPNKIFKIACGPYADDVVWTEVLMREAARFMDGLSLHYYTIAGDWERKGSATDFDEQGWFAVLQKAAQMHEILQQHTEIMDRYDSKRRVALVVDEWGTWHDPEPGTNPAFLFQQNTLRDALAAALTLNIFNNTCSRVRMANIAQTVNVLQAMLHTDGVKLVRTPTYYVFKLFCGHQDAMHVPVSIHCEDYVFAGQRIPALSVSASRNAADGITLSVCHVHPLRAAPARFDLQGEKIAAVRARILTHAAMNAYNTFDQPERLRPEAFVEFRVEGNAIHCELPAKSLVVLEIETRGKRG